MLRGGKTVYGASVGVLMLETRFPRLPGDIGHAESWDFPVQYRVVRGAAPSAVVLEDPRPLTQAFIEAGRDLLATGCDGITTSCGFLGLIQDELRVALDVPVAASSLMQVPLVQALLPPGRQVAILTVSAEALTPAHLAASRVPPATPVGGLPPEGAFAQTVLGDRLAMDVDACRDDLCQSAVRLKTRHPDVGAIVLECTNMVPFAADVRQITGVPVFSIHTFVTWFQAGLVPRRFRSVDTC